MIILFFNPDKLLSFIECSWLPITANNHCLDRGVGELVNTIKTLDKYVLSHIGTYNKKIMDLLRMLMK